MAFCDPPGRVYSSQKSSSLALGLVDSQSCTQPIRYCSDSHIQVNIYHTRSNTDVKADQKVVLFTVLGDPVTRELLKRNRKPVPPDTVLHLCGQLVTRFHDTRLKKKKKKKTTLYAIQSETNSVTKPQTWQHIL